MGTFLGLYFQRYLAKGEQDTPEFKEYATQVEEMGGPILKALADFLRTCNQQFQRPTNLPTPWIKTATDIPKTPTSTMRMTATRMPVTVSLNGKDEPVPATSSFVSCVPCGAGIDAFAQYDRVYLMKEKGRLKQVYQAPRNFYVDAYSDGLQFDGRLLWVKIFPKQRGDIDFTNIKPVTLLAIDPVTEQQVAITDADGLPPSVRILFAPWKPGVLFVAGYNGKSWCALVSVDKTGKKTVDIFFEARTYPESMQFNADRPVEATYVFVPSYLVKLTDRVTGNPLMLVGRVIPYQQGLGGRSCLYPLVVDPFKRTVVPLPKIIESSSSSEIVTREEMLYYRRYDGDGFYAMKYPEMQPQRITVPFALKPNGRITLEKERIHFIYLYDRTWWIGDTVTGPFKQVSFTEPFPDNVSLHLLKPSNNYGLLLIAQFNGENRIEFYQVGE